MRARVVNLPASQETRRCGAKASDHDRPTALTPTAPLRTPLSILRNFASASIWGGLVLSVLAVGFALLVREGLELFGQFYYLPLVPAVVVTAALAGRSATAIAISLSIAANVALVEREGPVDTWTNAVLFAVVCWLIAEICWRLRSYRGQAGELSGRLARRDQTLNTILASVPVVMLDDAGKVRALTRPAIRLLGTTEEAARGRPFSGFVDQFDLAALEAEVAHEPPEAEHVWTGMRDDGKTFPLHIQAGFMPNDAGGTRAVLCLTDLTQSHAADARARELHSQLNRVWRLNSLGEMAASLAHELNQPLAAAATYLHASQIDIERAGPIGASAARSIDLAKSQLLRAGEIIRRMRELLAHESRSLGVERIAPLVADLSGVFGMIERAGGVSIHIEIDDLNDRVRAERIQIQQAMLNLVRNAVEALAGQTDPKVLIVGRAISDDQFEIRVEDSGKGIPAAEMDTIFRPLMTTKSGGMGLGLSVTRTIVESHGGVLKVEKSALGGAAFSFCLMREHGLGDA